MFKVTETASNGFLSAPRAIASFNNFDEAESFVRERFNLISF